MPRIPPHLPLCIDGRMLVPGATGVGRYAAMLLGALKGMGGRPMVLTDDAPGRQRFGRTVAALLPLPRRVTPNGALASGAECLSGRHLFRAAQERFTLTGRFLEIESDTLPGIMHWTYPVPLRMRNWVNLYTVHDVIPLLQPELSPIDPRRLSAMLNKIATVADRIITVSDAARIAILSAIDLPPEIVVNCGQAVDSIAPAAVGGLLPAGLLRGDYYLYCGLVEPRKNLSRLIAAHARSGVARPLVIAGPDGWRASETGAGGGGPVLRLPYLPRTDLMALMGGARALLFPSLAEGFGLPVIEAMNADVPVLTSAEGALAEVAGGAALLIDPHDVTAMAEGINRLDRDPELRHRLVGLGRVRRQAFTPARFAAALGRVYAETIAGHNGSD